MNKENEALEDLLAYVQNPSNTDNLMYGLDHKLGTESLKLHAVQYISYMASKNNLLYSRANALGIRNLVAGFKKWLANSDQFRLNRVGDTYSDELKNISGIDFDTMERYRNYVVFHNKHSNLAKLTPKQFNALVKKSALPDMKYKVSNKALKRCIKIAYFNAYIDPSYSAKHITAFKAIVHEIKLCCYYA